jgi:hypothetical protein
MDMNDIVDNDFDCVMSKIIISKKREKILEIRNNINKMINDYIPNQYKNGIENIPEIQRKKVDLCGILYEKLNEIVDKRELKLFLHNCQRFYELECVESFTNHVCNYLEFIKDDLEKCLH